MRLRFVAPIVPPARLAVSGHLVHETEEAGRVEALVVDAASGTRYVEASYEFGRRSDDPGDPRAGEAAVGPDPAPVDRAVANEDPKVLVTGASGALGSAVLEVLAGRGIGVSREEREGLVQVRDLESVAAVELDGPIAGIVHCAWPPPDNQRLLAYEDPARAVEHHVAGPLRQALALGRLLVERGVEDAPLILVGSTAANPGRHNYRMPLYTLAKGLVPNLARILALELGPHRRRCVALVYDVIAGGMNENLSARAQIMHRDRAPTGRIPSPQDAAAQVGWILTNSSFLISGATIEVTGGAIP